MERDKIIIYMVFVFSLGIGSDRSVEAQKSQTNYECTKQNYLNNNCINIQRCPTHYPLENQQQNSSIIIQLRNSTFVNEDNSTYYPKVRLGPLENEPTTNTESSQRTTTRVDDLLNHLQLEMKLSNVIKSPSQEICGRREIDLLMVNGDRSKLGDWPWMAGLGYLNLNMPNSGYEWKCVGSLISDRFVLTAAHCTVGLRMSCLAVVRLGHVNYLTTHPETIDVGILRVIRHEEYNIQEATNDIALLKLNNSVGFNHNIKPICLPILSHHRTNTFVGSYLSVTGWGTTWFGGPQSYFLMEGILSGIDNSKCKRVYDKINFVINDKMLCAKSGWLTRIQDACQGDSGGPLMWRNDDGQYYLVGIVSFGLECGIFDYPGVYTRVTSFAKWIEDNMN